MVIALAKNIMDEGSCGYGLKRKSNRLLTKANVDNRMALYELSE